MPSSYRILAIVLGATLFLLAGYDTATSGPASTGFFGGAAPAGALTTDTVKVFVVWGTSNACGTTDTIPSPSVPNGTAYEWYHNGSQVRNLADPMPCYSHNGVSGDKGTPWTSFAVTHDSLSDDILFMSSVALGGQSLLPESAGRVVANPDTLDWSPSSDGELYDLGVATIDAAMTRANALVDSLAPTYEVVFGGVLWIQGNDLRDIPPRWTAYRDALHGLLDAFHNDVIEGAAVSGDFDYVDARFYHVNTPVDSSLTVPGKEAGFYLDLEADVCADYAFCSMTQASDEVWHAYDACGADAACKARWYNDFIHWAQDAQNRVGWQVARVVRAHEAALAGGAPDPFTFEVGVEVAQPWNYRDTLDYRPVRLDVYDDAGLLVDAFVIDSTIANPDWTADFDGDGGADWDTLWTELGTEFLTFEFVRDDDTAPDDTLGRYVFVPTDIAYGAGATNFFRPEPGNGPADTRFEVNVDTTAAFDVVGVRAKTAFVGPFLEEVFADAYVVPYNDAYVCTPACPPGYFLARLPVGAARPDAAERRFTFASEADVAILETWGALGWDVEGLVVAFGPETRFRVKGGAFTADDVVFTAADTTGWLGLRFEEGSEGTLSGVTVEGVKGPASTAGDAAVEVYDGTVTLNGSTVEDGANVHGVWASGSNALVTLDQSLVENMEVDGVGVVAAAGAEVRVYGNTTIRLNGYTGAAATGMGSLLYLYESIVTDNDGYGVVSQSSGEVVFGRHDSTTSAASVEVSLSALGGLFAITDGDLTAGLYDDTLGVCTDGCENRVLDNWQGSGNFDAKAQGSGSVVVAERDFWGLNRTLGQLELFPGGGGVIDVTPLWNGQAPRMGDPSPRARRVGPPGASAALRGGTGRGGTLPEGTLPLPDSSAVLTLVDAAYTAAALGDSAAASAALLAALPLVQTPEEHGLAFGTAARFLSHGGDPALEGYLSTRTGTEDEARPWALAALMAADAAEGRTAEAWARADTLSAEYAGTDHALPGLGMTVRLAAEAVDLASAEAARASLEAGWPDLLETASAEALVRRLQEMTGANGRTGVGVTGIAPVVEARSSAEAIPSFRLLGARPNPFTGRTTLPFELAAPARLRVAVYDVLGREVALLADGAFEPGRYEAVFDGRGLASGLYLVQARVESGAGARRTYATQITLVR
jgi:hypothetical protein